MTRGTDRCIQASCAQIEPSKAVHCLFLPTRALVGRGALSSVTKLLASRSISFSSGIPKATQSDTDTYSARLQPPQPRQLGAGRPVSSLPLVQAARRLVDIIQPRPLMGPAPLGTSRRRTANDATPQSASGRYATYAHSLPADRPCRRGAAPPCASTCDWQATQQAPSALQQAQQDVREYQLSAHGAGASQVKAIRQSTVIDSVEAALGACARADWAARHTAPAPMRQR